VDTFVVSNLNDSGVGSLRSAIEAANAAGSPSTISFSVDGVITLNGALPAIGADVTIDGTSAPSHVAGGPPVVEVNFNNNAGLTFAPGSEGAQLLGLSLCGASGDGVTLDAGSITLADDYVGLTLGGQALGNSGDGVYVASGSSNDLIGSNPTAASGVVSNVISGNGGNGISLNGSSQETLVDNYIGTNPSGTAAIANGGDGILLTDGAGDNEIGGTASTDTSTGAANDPTGDKGQTTPVFVVPPLGNLVSGNSGNGVLIEDNSQNNVLNGNFVGTTANGNEALGNALDGVDINGSDNNALIGCLAQDNPFIYYNVASGNGANGLEVTDSNNIVVHANFFGIGANNSTVIGNAQNGILVDGSSQNVQVGGIIPLGNVAAGNGQNGIEVTDTVGGFTTFNTFGGLFAFGGAAPNGNDGLLLTATGGNQTVQTNVFSGNLNNGIEIGGNASGVTVDPNIAGLNTIGGAALPNGGDGLLIDGTANNNVIGGYQVSVIPQNTFSGNVGYGIAIEGQAYNNNVFNTFIGTGVSGTTALGNQAGGILVGGSATNNIIGGATVTSGGQPVADLVSGNNGNGITLGAGTNLNSILNNSIGYDRLGLPLLPNSGVAIAASGNANFIFGNSTFTVTPAGTGNNPVVPVGGNDLIVANGSHDVILPDTGGNETIFAFGPVLAAMGSGTMYFVNGNSPSTVIGGGSGNAIINGGAGGGLYAGGTGGANVIVGGSGACTMFGSSGSDLLMAGGAQANLLVAGSGNETLTGSGSTGANVMYAGSGNDLLGGGAGNETFFAGHGNATVIGGSGADLYGFINGLAGGTETVFGFSTAKGDAIALQGYGPGEAQNDLANAVVAGGNTTLTLSDHTQVTFVGVTNLNASAFT
jgi:hypothetical protein